MINVFYGRESKDKGKFIFSNIKSESIVLVPDQYTLEAEKDAFEFLAVKGFIDKEILGFSRLCDRILDECGHDRRTAIDKYGRHMILARILEKKKEELTVYKNLERTPGFIEMVNNFLAQIRQNNITCDMLASIKENVPEKSLLKKKLTDICMIYAAYEEAIEGKYLDSEMYIDSVIERIGTSEYIKGKNIWIYGFDTFTEKNYEIIRRLAVFAESLNVVLTYDKNCADAGIFRPAETALIKLKSIALEENIEYTCIPIEGYDRQRSIALSHLEKNLYSIPAEKCENCEGITAVKAGNIYGEAESAAAYIISLVRDKGLRYGEIALVCNNMEEDGPVISRVFSRYGIPLFIDRKRKVYSSGIATYILSLLAVVSKGYDSSDIFRMLKTGLAGFEDSEIEKLENYAYMFKIKGSAWKKPFTKDFETDETLLATAEELRERLINMLSDFEADFKKSRNMSARIRALYEFMTSGCGIVEKIEKETERLCSGGYHEEAAHTAQVWNIVCRLLEQIDELIGECNVNNDELLKMLETGLAEAETGIIPQTADGVSAGTCQRSRFGRIKALVVMSANEGVLPRNSNSEELLSNDELLSLESENITLLKIDKIKNAEEAMGVYRTFAAPTEYLWMGTAASDASGEAIKPSPLISVLKRIFPKLKESHDIFNDGEPLHLVAGPESTMEHLAGALRESLDGREIGDVWKAVAGWINRDSRYSTENIEKGLFYKAGTERVNREKAIGLYSRGADELKLSPSGLEQYARCPFAYFINYGLSPKERRVFEMAGREIGDVYHEILKKMSDRLTDEGIAVTAENSKWMTISEEEYKELIDELVSDEIKDYRNGILEHSAEEKYRTDRLKKIVTRIGMVLIKQVRAGKIREAAFEAGFGRGRKIPPVEVEVNNRKIYIEGIIDRLDVLPDDSIKIIDYKTGDEKFSTAEAKSGWKLQLMVYLAAGLKYGNVERKPAGIFYFKINEPRVDMSGKPLPDDAGDIPADFRLEGAVVNDPVAIQSIAGDFEKSSDIVYLKRNRDGMITGSGKERLFEPEEFNNLMDEVNDTVKNICQGIADGEIAAAPKKKNHNMSSCTYCKYSGICRFDTVFSDCRYEWI